jgi:hypothetical protein
LKLGKNVKFGIKRDVPATVSGLDVWLRSDMGITKDISNRVSEWKDSSGNGRHVSQATGGKQPLYSDNYINGNPALYFDASRIDTLVSSSYTHGHNTEATVFIVVKQTVNPAVGGITMSKGAGALTSGGFQVSMNKDGVLVSGAIDTTTSNYNYRGTVTGIGDYTNWHIEGSIIDVTQTKPDELMILFDGVNYALSVDLSSSGSVDDISASTPLFIGARNNGFPMSGYIAEIIIYARKLYAEERIEIENYLSARYGIALQYSSIAKAYDGLVAWYDAAAGITKDGSNRVSAWADQSGTGDANKNLAQGSAGNQPLYVANDSNFNNRPSLRFENYRPDYMASGIWAANLPTPSTHIAIGRYESLTTNANFFDGGGAATRQSVGIWGSASGTPLQPVSYSGSAINDAKMYPPRNLIIGAVFGSSAKLYTSKTTPVTGNSGTQILDQYVVATYGAGPASNSSLKGNLAEIAVYNRALNQLEMEQFLQLMSSKYNIPLYDSLSPDQISGMVAWYDAAEGVTIDGSNRVSAWADQSGTGDANKNLSQPAGGNQPLWKRNSSNLNGRPVIIFDKARSDDMRSGVWSTPLAQPATWLIVARITGTSSIGATITAGVSSSNQHAIAYIQSFENMILYAGTLLQSGISVGSLPTNQAVLGVFNNTLSKIYQSQKTAVSGTAGTHTLTQLLIGASPSVVTYDFSGEIAEIVGFNRDLTQHEISALLTWAGNKYNISIGA